MQQSRNVTGKSGFMVSKYLPQEKQYILSENFNSIMRPLHFGFSRLSLIIFQYRPPAVYCWFFYYSRKLPFLSPWWLEVGIVMVWYWGWVYRVLAMARNAEFKVYHYTSEPLYH